MSKKIVAVNAGPRKGWNTDILVTEAAEGAKSAGAEVERFDLYRLGKQPIHEPIVFYEGDNVEEKEDSSPKDA